MVIGLDSGYAAQSQAGRCDLNSKKQHTIASEVSLSGVGLFGAQPVSVRIKPAQVNHGVVFRRIDLPDSPEVPASVLHEVSVPRRTALRFGDAQVQTVEHLLAAFWGLGVDNALVEIDAEEVAILDGSALPFAQALLEAGLVEQAASRRPIVVTEPITLRDGDKTISALPTESEGLELLYMLDYGENSPIRRQVQSFMGGRDDFVELLAPARTFSTRAEAEAARAMGLFHHLTPSEMLVIDDDGPIDNEYRFPDEPVRHKLLDMMGDLALAGRPICGRIVGVRTGHDLNRKMAAALLGAAVAEDESAAKVASLDLRRVLEKVRGSFPALLVDRVLEVDRERGTALGVKNVSASEPHMDGDSEEMPTSLVLEAMAQLAAVLLHQQGSERVSLVGEDSVRVHRSVRVGDQMLLEAELVGGESSDELLTRVRASVAGICVATGVLSWSSR